MEGTSIFDRLNTRQREAAWFGTGGTTPGPLLIIAGAGTGKTNTLAHRVAHLVLEGASPERVLLLTFTRRAALEMTRRTQRVVATMAPGGKVQKDVRFPWSGTFHSIANRLLRRYCAAIGLDASFSVLDRGDAADLMDVVRHDLGLSNSKKRFPRKDTCLAIYSHRVNTQRPLMETLDGMFPWCAEWEADLTRLYRAYVEKKLANQALDYDDLLLYWHAMMADDRLAAEMGSQFDHILVDEYQDTNVLQADILMRLRPGGEGVTVVGDDAQAIYAFRAATVENILGFPAQYAKGDGAGATVITLEENYRSTQGVLDAANALIGQGQRQYRKVLRASRGGGAPPRYVTVADDQGQADYIVTRVLETRERGVALRHQAVLFRNSHHSDVLELELTRRNIPYVKYGGLKFLEAAHVKDMLAVLRWADNPKNRIAAFRALQLLPGMGPATAERLLLQFASSGYSWTMLREFSGSAAMAESWQPFAALMEQLAVPEGPWQGQMSLVRQWFEPHMERIYDSASVRAGDLEQLERIAQQFATREQFLTEMALDPPQATGDLAGTPYLDEDYLVLSTIHSAKGQEWDAVYLLNVADGEFPSEFATGRADQIEEERRLLYVAMTRAKNDLHLIAPLKYYVTSQSRMGDRHVYGAKSRFLTDAVMSTLEPFVWPDTVQSEAELPQPGAPRIDVASKLRGLWT
ncbi:MAG TPA: ATP-dependent helicase [Vicinamibacterales bacterium]|nr:ATP-dependent helicase [Vicinamibacterales bacterium]